MTPRSWSQAVWSQDFNSGLTCIILAQAPGPSTAPGRDPSLLRVQRANWALLQPLKRPGCPCDLGQVTAPLPSVGIPPVLLDKENFHHGVMLPGWCGHFCSTGLRDTPDLNLPAPRPSAVCATGGAQAAPGVGWGLHAPSTGTSVQPTK